jgi:hypothetical protein
MPSVRMATDRAVKLDVDVEGMVALIREAGNGPFHRDDAGFLSEMRRRGFRFNTRQLKGR